MLRSIKEMFQLRSCLLAAAIICAACNGQTPAASNARRQTPPNKTPAATSGGEIRLRPYIVQDPQLGVEAFRFLMPVDWKVEGGVVWRAHPARPATVSIRIYNPAGLEEIGTVPDIPCVWAVTLPSFGFRIGSFYLGNEVRPPITDAVECLRRMILPRYASRLPGAKVVGEEQLPDMAQAWKAANYPELQGQVGSTARFSGGKIRVEYEAQGNPVEMDIYTVVGMWTIPIQGVPTTFWGADPIRYSRAPKGKLDQQYKLFQAILYSEKMNIQWLNRYTQVRDMMVQSQMEASNRAVELSRYLSHVNNQISDSIRRSYEHREAAMDRVNAQFDRYIRGVDEYRNPYGSGSVELPSGYRDAWMNSQGEYILSDNPNFNPNVGGVQQWRQMQRKP